MVAARRGGRSTNLGRGRGRIRPVGAGPRARLAERSDGEERRTWRELVDRAFQPSDLQSGAEGAPSEARPEATLSLGEPSPRLSPDVSPSESAPGSDEGGRGGGRGRGGETHLPR